jgi:site-specific recombinase XerD
MKKSRVSARFAAADQAVFNGAFLSCLQERGLSPQSISRVRWAVRRAGRWLARRRRLLVQLKLKDAPAVLAASVPRHWKRSTRKDYKGGLACWFKFRAPGSTWPGKTKPRTDFPWQHWIDDFTGFLKDHRGLGPKTCAAYRRLLEQYLAWQFGRGEGDWSRVTPQDVWDYAQAFRRGRTAGTLNHELVRLRRFFLFLELRGHGAARLANAVPRFSNFGQFAHPAVLSEQQRRALLASFDLTTTTGLRDHGLALCMVDLGLRPSEAARLTLQDVDWEAKMLTVPKTKTDRGRELPLAARMVSAMRRYVRRGRPATLCQSLFVRPDASGAHMPMDARTIGYAMKAAYRRCKFPREWNGSYRLRHTFATRLHARGADLKEIADLLGHQHLKTTTIYAQVDPVGLRALALPWPLSS